MSWKRILAIDDEPDLLELLEMLLEKSELEVLTATDGTEGLDLARSEHPDLILLDLMMGGMDGWETLRRLKHDEQCSSIPVVILSARSEAKDKIRALQDGAIDYLTKPFSVPESLDRIRSILSDERLRELSRGGGSPSDA